MQQQQKDIINTKANRQLLFRYLSKQYGSDKAKYLMVKHKDHQFSYGGLAWLLGKSSIEFFSMYFLQDTFQPKPDNEARKLSQTHLEVWSLIDDCFVHDKFSKLLLCLPRGFAKSTFITFATVLQQACYSTDAGFFQIVMGKTDRDSQTFCFDIRKQLEENPYINYCFGSLIDTKKFTVNKNELHLTNNCKVNAVSSTSSIRGTKHLGKRPSTIYLDDTQGLDDVLTEQAKEKKMEVFQKDILYAGDEPVYRDGKKIKSGTRYIVCGTILARDCFVSRLIKDKTFKSIVKRAVLVDDIDKLFANEYWTKFREIYFDDKNQYAQIDAQNYYQDHENEMKFPVLWPDKWLCTNMAIKYFNNSNGFKQEMMNDSSSLTGGKCFFNIKSMPREEMDKLEFDRTMITVDCAVATKKRSDFTAICIGSRGLNGYRYIRKGLLLKVNFDDYVDTVIQLLRDYPEITHLSIEKNTYQGVDAKEIKKIIDNNNELSHRNITIINDYQNRNKENRIRSMAGKINNGFIIFCDEDEEFTDQILQYEGSDVFHDDAADCTCSLDESIDEIQVIQPIKFYNVQF